MSVENACTNIKWQQRHNDISIFTLDETTTGTMAVVDLDGDGYVEIVSAGYTVGKVYVHTFAPE